MPTASAPPPSSGAPASEKHKRTPLAWSVGVVGLIAGVMFAMNATLFATPPDDRRPENLAELVHLERERLNETNTEVEELRSQVSDLIEVQRTVSGPSEAMQMANGRVPVVGPGVVVKLWDAPMRESLPEGVRPDDLIIHQQDLEAVINGLWAGGAEAMAVQGHRVTARSSIRCVGNVLLIDGSVYSPPYEISAIGEPRALMSSLMSSPEILTYLEYVEVLQLGWSLEAESELEIAADEGSLTMQYAALPGQEPLSISPTPPQGNAVTDGQGLE